MYGNNHNTLDIFIEVYRAYPITFFGVKNDIEYSNSIILPSSALEKLTRLQKFSSRDAGSQGPMLFRILNIELNIYTHCGVLEFNAEEGCCYLPLHMFNRLYLTEGMKVNIRDIKLEKGKFIKIQPHKTDFTTLPNPKTILENALRNFMCVTKGDSIVVPFNKVDYYIDIIECKPKDAISLTNVDVEVDFAEPLDYKDIPKEDKLSSINIDEEKKKPSEAELLKKIQNEKFQGHATRIDGKTITEHQIKKVEVDTQQKKEAEVYDPRKNRLKNGINSNAFKPFEGSGANLKQLEKKK